MDKLTICIDVMIATTNNFYDTNTNIPPLPLLPLLLLLLDYRHCCRRHRRHRGHRRRRRHPIIASTTIALQRQLM